MAITVFPGMPVRNANAPRMWGTLSFIAKEERNPAKRYLVSNTHVLADPSARPSAQSVIEAALSIRGPWKRVATLSHWMTFNDRDVFPADIAMAELNPETRVDPASPFINAATGRTGHFGVATSLFTHGASTGRKMKGTISGPSGIRRIRQTSPNNTYRTIRVRIDGVVESTDYGDFGDSGAPVVNRWGRLMGVHVAETRSEKSLFCRIDFVLKALSDLAGVTIVPHIVARDDVDLERPDRLRLPIGAGPEA